MRILWLTNVPSPYRVDFFNELGKECELTVLFEKRTSDERDKSWKNYKFDNFEGVFLRGKSVNTDTAICPEVIRYVKRRSYDHVIVTNISSPTGIMAVEYMKAHHIPYWVEGDGGFAKSGKGFKETIKKRIISNAKGCFSTGVAHDEYYLTYGAEQKNIWRYPFTSLHERDILAEPISVSQRQELRKKLNIKERNVVLSVGRFSYLGGYGKGYDVLLRAAKIMGDEYGWYIVGGEPTDEFRRMTDEASLNNFHYIGHLGKEKLNQYYQAADVFAFMTIGDVWGLVINEAMANGLPVVSTDRCGAALELIHEGENGFVVPVGDVLATVGAIQKVMGADKAKMSGQSLIFCRDYTIESMTHAHIKIISEQ